MDAPLDRRPTEEDLSRRAALARVARAALATGALLPLAACSSSGSAAGSTGGSTDRPASLGATIHRPTPMPEYTRRAQTPRQPAAVHAEVSGLMPRSSWAKGSPIPTRMDRMRPISRITVHHDGMDAFTDTSQGGAAARIERIRRGHVGRGWGDIGYHYVIDPAGRVWAARPIDWQGAHVKDHNEGNIGVCVLGNYERQRPNAAQHRAVAQTVSKLMHARGVSPARVYTHRELRPTACPGATLQAYMNQLRGPRGTLAAV